MAEEFIREERYVVVKLKRLNAGQKEALAEFFADWDIPTVESVVIESHTPEYEKVWQLLEESFRYGGDDGSN